MNNGKEVLLIGRKRPRSSIVLVFLGGISLITSGTTALSSVTTKRLTVKIATPPLAAPATTTRTESIKSEDEGESDAVAVDPDMLELIQRLQESGGPEVLSSDEQALAESKTPENFLEQLGCESTTEKVAMSSITEQLPKASLHAFSASRGLSYSHHRVTVDHEQRLGRVIQWGSTVMQHKCDNPKEWAAAAGLPSTKALRQTVVAYQRAKHLLVTANMGLVHTVVQDQTARRLESSYEELLQEGSLGLMRAAELFDPSRGLRFSTYAVIWIKSVIIKTHVGELVRVPQRERVIWNKMRAAKRELRALNDRKEPSAVDIAKLTGLTVDQVENTEQHFRRLQHMDSMDAKETERTSSGVESKFEKQYLFDDEGLAERTQFRADLIALLKSKLNAREARFMRLRYGLNGGPDRSLRECGEAMGLSYSAMQKLNTVCLKKLREADEISALEDYLFTIA